MHKARFGSLTDSEWVDTLNEWLAWARTLTNDDNIGLVPFGARYNAPDYRRGSRVARLLEEIGLIKKTKSFVDSKPTWWVAPEGGVTLEDFIRAKDAPPPLPTRLHDLQIKRAGLQAELAEVQRAIDRLTGLGD